MQDTDRAAIAAYERHILAAEGPRTIGGTYYPRETDAEQQRRWAAERMVREARRNGARDRAEFAGRARVGTWLAPRERGRVDVAAGALADFTHRDTVHALRGDLITGRVDAAIVSASTLRRADVPALAAIVRDFPGTPVIGFVCDADESQALAGTLACGHAGVRHVVDARTAGGWSELRTACDAHRLPDTFVQRAVRDLTHNATAEGEAYCTAGWTQFLATAFAPRVSSAKQVAASLGVCCSTLTSRFYRAGLPSPKRSIAGARLVWTARLAETPGLPLRAIAHRLDASSPQSFGRTVRTMIGVSAGTFRRQFTGESMLARYATDLIEPYRDVLRTFDPLTMSQAEREQASRKRPVAGRAA